MRSEAALRGADRPSRDARVVRMGRCAPSFWRYLYTEVGRAYHWVDRLGWTDQDIRGYLSAPGLELWVLTVGSAAAGYFELRPDGEGGIEIAYFGLLPQYTGHGLGKYLLSEAARRAWALHPSRVWLHTSTLDHPSALTNYLARGFAIVRTEPYEI
jgi:ribosomal protein S18 acetylase RimI-like enzyme